MIQKITSLFYLSFLVFCTQANFSQNLSKPLGSVGQVMNAPCYNEDFELSAAGAYTATGAIPGWTISCAPTNSSTGACTSPSLDTWTQAITEFSIHQTPLVGIPFIGVIQASPLGGTKIAQLNNQVANGTKTRLRTTYPVTQYNSVLGLSFCTSLDGSGHACCSQPYVQVNIYNCSGVIQPCMSFSIIPTGSQCAMPTSGTFSVSNGVAWTNWTSRQIDLQMFQNSCVTVEIIASDCSAGDHHASLFMDATCLTQYQPLPSFTPTCFPLPVNLCSSSTVAVLNAPSGYLTYNWTAPPFVPPITGSQVALPSLTVTNPLPGSVYSVNMTTSSGCIFIATYTIAYSSVSISAIGTTSTCAGGSSGSATVAGTGSGTGYTYTWTNNSNSVISTSSSVSNLPPGNYTVTLGAIGSTACGTSTANVVIGIRPPDLRSITWPFCGNTANINAFTGSNFRWYSGGVLIPNSNVSTFTVSSPTNNSTLVASFDTNQGCRDSVAVILFSVNPGSVLTISNPTMCVGAINGGAVIQITPQTGGPTGQYGIVLSATGTNAPLSYSLSSSTAGTFSLSNLLPGPYSYTATDGICTYTSTFTKSALLFDFTLSAVPQICNNSCLNAPLTLTSNVSSSVFGYTWSPTSYVSGTGQQRMICPNLAPGTQTSIQYTVTANSSVANCPQSKTITISMSTPTPGTLSALPAICHSGGTVQAVAQPTGGIFLPGPLITPSGIITPSLVSPGTHTYTYVTSLSQCSISVTNTININAPQFNVPGSTSICSGGTATISLSPNYQYTWSNGSNGNQTTYSPSNTGTHWVTALDNSNGCAITKTFAIVVNALPNLIISGPQQACINTPVTYTASGGTTYAWSTGQTQNIITFTPSSNTIIVVTSTNNFNCIASSSISLQLSPYPLITVYLPQIICRGTLHTFTATGALSYSWSPGGTANPYSYVPMSPQTLTVTGTSNGCSSTMTLAINVLECTGVEKENLHSGNIYPNPFKNTLYVSGSKNSTAEIFSSDGKLLRRFELEEGLNELDLSELSEGIYFLKTEREEVVKTYKLQKI